MNRAPKLAALALAVPLALAGCAAQPAAETAPTETVAPAAGETISGSDYTFVVPEGWGEPEQEIPGFDPDAFAADLDDTDGFADNVNVILSPAGEVTPEQVESLGVDELEGAGATEVATGERIEVAGRESAHLSALLASGGESYRIEQYYVTRDGQTYVVTFSFSPTVSEGDRIDLARSVLASWAWS